MSNENKETIADILAAKRESEATCEKTPWVGNAAAMRDALEQAQRVLHCAIVADILKGEDAHEALNAVSTALSVPPRNCDVGTVEEQTARFDKFCRDHRSSYGDGCGSCPYLRDESCCEIIWSQMPYEKEGAK